MTAVLLVAPACHSPKDDVEATPAGEPPSGAVVVEGRGLEADLARVRAFHAERPLYEQPLGVGREPPAGVGSLSAEACGACHPEIYAEWKVSTHAAAWHDRQFQAEIGKSDNRWLCLNCHTPLLVAHDRWPVGLVDGDVERPLLVPNPSFDAALRDEGITCAACHVRDGVIHGPGLSEPGEEPAASPHPVELDPAFRTNDACTRCHQATARYPGKTFICTFDTGQEWAAGPYPAEGRGCADCHMPAIERPAAVGGPVRTVRRHWWRGAGVPKEAAVHPPVEANPPGLAVAATWAGDALTLTLTNERAGHLLPTGDPERWVQIDVRFEDGSGAPIGEPWSTRIGQTWRWEPEPERVADNRLAPRESRELEIAVPAGAAAAVVEAANHRIAPEIAAYHHLGDYPRSVPTHRLAVTPEGVTGGLLE